MTEPKKTAAAGKKRSAKTVAPKTVAAKPAAAKFGATKSAAAESPRLAATAPKAAARAAANAFAAVTADIAPKKAPLHTVADASASAAAEAMKAFEPAVEAAKLLEVSVAMPAPVAAVVDTVRTAMRTSAKADDVVAPAARLMEAGAERALQSFARARTTGESFRQAVTETASASTRAAFEVNDKVIDALRAQSDAAFDVWRSTVTAGSLSEAIRVQTSGARQVYETAATHWRDVAATTTRWFGETVKPIQSVLGPGRQA